ncbi:MAG: DUF421 domain-containing protein [Bacilli bacterium]|nr:DUF421 domain-containing protein [Bacilli bacterium]
MYIGLVWKSVVLYFYMLVMYRMMGKKEIEKLSITDFIVTILMAECAIYSISQEKVSIFNSIIPITALGILQMIISYVSMKSDKFRKIVDGTPSVIIKNGKLIFSTMSKLRYTLDDLVTSLREHGVKSVEEVNYAVLENNGKLSIFPKEVEYPMPIILDGVVQNETLREIGKDEVWLNTVLRQKKLALNEVFYAFYTSKKTFIITRSDLL